MIWAIKYSSIEKIIRLLSQWHRWRVNAYLPKAERCVTHLKVAELQTGLTYLIKGLQRLYFHTEIKSLNTGDKKLSRSSSILRLIPFLDEKGVLRVGGRLQNCLLSNKEKHPAILPIKNHIAKLLVRQAHLDTLHGGSSLVQGHLSRRFQLVRGRNYIRKIIRKCIICALHHGITMQQQMGPLPVVCLRPTRVFTHTGVDYAGPFWIKFSLGRGAKSFKTYVAIFVCMVVHAMHIEVVSDLTSVAFLAAF